jgi:hypothetical protein
MTRGTISADNADVTNAIVAIGVDVEEGIAAGSIDTTDIATGGVDTAELADDAVTADKVADGAIDAAAKFAASVVDNAAMADDAIDSAEIAAGAVDNTHLSGGFLKVVAANGTDSAVDVTVTGIAVGDELVSVLSFDDDAVTGAFEALLDRTSEYVVAADTLTKAAGTDDTGNRLLIIYLDLT